MKKNERNSIKKTQPCILLGLGSTSVYNKENTQKRCIIFWYNLPPTKILKILYIGVNRRLTLVIMLLSSNLSLSISEKHSPN